MLMLIGAFFISASLEDSGLLKRVAFYLMCKVKGNYFALLMSLMVVSILLNILTFGNAYVIMPPLALGLCISLNGMKNLPCLHLPCCCLGRYLSTRGAIFG